MTTSFQAPDGNFLEQHSQSSFELHMSRWQQLSTYAWSSRRKCI